MKIDLTTPILEFDGVTPVKKPATIIAKLDNGMQIELSPDAQVTLEDGTKVTAGWGQENMDLAHVLMETCRAVLKDDQEEAAEEKFWRYEMGRKIFLAQKGDLDLPIEEWTKLQERVAKVYSGSIVYGNVYGILNPEELNKDKEEEEDTTGDSEKEKTEEIVED